MSKRKLTKTQKDFIGSTFTTPTGGILTVVGVFTKCSSRSTLFLLECSICSVEDISGRDIKSTKGNLMRGHIPCDCRRGRQKTEHEWDVIVRRKADTLGYTCLGWAGIFSGVFTYLRLYNPKTDNTWNTTDINHFINAGRSDPVEGRGRISKARMIKDEQHISEFYESGKFIKGTNFWRSLRLNKDGYKSYWKYTCPVCSFDDYVKCGLCSGEFEAIGADLKRGKLTCRCNKDTFRWNQQQREYQINIICEDEGLTFIGWVAGHYNKSTSKLKWVCAEGHYCECSVTSFVNKRSRCPTCDKIRRKEVGYGNGYYERRITETDYLYVIIFNGEYIKVGRAFNIENRMKGNRGLVKQSNFKREQLDVVAVLTGNHGEVYRAEQKIHKALVLRGYYHRESKWTTETFTLECLPYLYKILEVCGLERVDSNSL